MSVAANDGTGISLSSKFYMRNFYSANRDASSKTTRGNFSNSRLSYDDAAALRRAVNKLGSFSYDTSSSTNIRSSVKAYVETYNNLLSSAGASSDDSVSKSADKLKSLTKEYQDQLDKVGVTVNEDGTLTSRESLLANADISKFEELFSSDSDFMQKSNMYAKRIQNYSEILYNNEQIKASQASGSFNQKPDTVEENDTTDAAEIVAQSAVLDSLQRAGIGRNVDIVL